jgi:hypothetical protein
VRHRHPPPARLGHPDFLPAFPEFAQHVDHLRDVLRLHFSQQVPEETAPVTPLLVGDLSTRHTGHPYRHSEPRLVGGLLEHPSEALPAPPKRPGPSSLLPRRAAGCAAASPVLISCFSGGPWRDTFPCSPTAWAAAQFNNNVFVPAGRTTLPNPEPAAPPGRISCVSELATDICGDRT